MHHALLAAVLVLTACGNGVRTGAPAAHGGAAEQAPPTDADPPPWVPAAEDDAQTGRAVGVATSGGYDQARAVAIRFVQAVRDGDEAALERLLAERVGRAFPRLTTPNRNREDLVNAVLRSPRRAGLGPDVPLDDLIAPARMEVTPLVRHSQPMPRGLSGSDLLVEFPLETAGRRWFRFLLGWPADGRIVVRPGVEPQIVCL